MTWVALFFAQDFSSILSRKLARSEYLLPQERRRNFFLLLISLPPLNARFDRLVALPFFFFPPPQIALESPIPSLDHCREAARRHCFFSGPPLLLSLHCSSFPPRNGNRSPFLGDPTTSSPFDKISVLLQNGDAFFSRVALSPFEVRKILAGRLPPPWGFGSDVRAPGFLSQTFEEPGIGYYWRIVFSPPFL